MQLRSKLSGADVKRLQDALLSAFPTRNALAQIVRVGLDENLDAVAAQENLRAVVFELIRWTEAQGRLDALIAAARAANPGNPELRVYASSFSQNSSTKTEPDHGTDGRAELKPGHVATIQSPSGESGLGSDGALIPPLRIERLELRNIRNIAALTLEFTKSSGAGGSRTCIIGPNGVGKSTILQSIALALLGDHLVPELGQKRLAAMCRRKGSTVCDSEIRAWVHDNNKLRELYVPLSASGINIDALASHSEIAEMRAFWRKRETEHLFAAYGPGRNLCWHLDERHTHLGGEVRRQMTLFDPLAQVTHADLLVGHDGRPAPALVTLRTLVENLFDRSPFPIVEDGSLKFLVNDAIVSPAELPDGFRATIGWLIDLCAAWHHKAPEEAMRGDFSSMRGIILVDEIDLHLHPKLQRDLVANLRRVLPAAQFIVTTHSPMVAAGFEPTELIVLGNDQGEAGVVDDRTHGSPPWFVNVAGPPKREL